VIGKPTLPPFWALGWHQASWKYQNQSMVEDVVGNYASKNIPLETIWLDIPYMDKFADFSVDTVAFPNLKNYTEKVLHANN
jgi:alpha-glucosidase (family GH31 glycosyl hydrolase)